LDGLDGTDRCNRLDGHYRLDRLDRLDRPDGSNRNDGTHRAALFRKHTPNGHLHYVNESTDTFGYIGDDIVQYIRWDIFKWVHIIHI
jgi:hypothetical protein